MNLHRLGSLALLALLAAGCVTPLENRRWIAIQTEHFQFLTDDDEAKSVELARDFEIFHSFMEQMTGGQNLAARIPTVVYLFADQTTYRRFGVPNSVGYFSSTGRANYIGVGKALGFTDTLIAFHEYSHYMMRRKGLFGYPMWYDEGYAEFVGTARVRDERFELGRAAKERVDTLARIGPMKLRRMITAKNVSEWSPVDVAQLYATSWIFVHYLYNSTYTGGANRWVQKDQFLSRINEGMDPEEAFKVAFGADFKQIEDELEGYSKHPGVLQIPIARFGAVSEPKVRPLSSAEALTRLGELQMASGRAAGATAILERALAIDPKQPRARALLGRALGAQDRHDDAEAMFTQALAQEPDSPLNHLDYGLYLTSRAIERNEDTLAVEPTDLPPEQRSAYLKRGRAEYERSIALDASIPEAHSELAYTYLAPGEPAAQGIEHADTAFDLLPSDILVALQLAEVLVAAGQLEEARPVLTRLLPEASRSKRYKIYLDGLLARVAKAQAAP